MKPVEDVPAEKAAAPRPKGSLVTDWVVPIVLGVAIGTAAVWAWPRVMHSPARRIVDRVVERAGVEEDHDPEKFAKELRALGPAARDDLFDAIRSLPAHRMDWKIWVARLLTGEPWFATVSLKEMAKNAKEAKADRRAAACALVDSQDKEVDPELVLPVFEEWLLDAEDLDHVYAIQRLDRMGRLGMFSAQWEARIRKGMLAVADRTRRVSGGEEAAELLEADRADALLALSMFLPDEEVARTLWSTAKDETDGELARVHSVRPLSDGRVLDAGNLADWALLAKSKNDVVRQAVADNLQRATLPEYDQVLTPLLFDANPLARSGALDSQVKRRRPTMLERLDELLEDADEWVRFRALIAAGSFRKEVEAHPRVPAMIVRLLATSENPNDVEGAVLALTMLTDQQPPYGFQASDVRVNEQDVEDTAIAAFMADAAGRRQWGEKWLAHFPGATPWTDADRVKTLEKLLQHADPGNVERARQELAKLRK